MSLPPIYLKSTPGIGLLTIANVLAETNGFEQFHSISQLMSFSGYDVAIRKSGKWQGESGISKSGIQIYPLYMPTSTVIHSKGPITELYQRLLGNHNIKMKVHVAVQKRLLTYMYVLWDK